MLSPTFAKTTTTKQEIGIISEFFNLLRAKREAVRLREQRGYSFVARGSRVGHSGLQPRLAYVHLRLFFEIEV